MNDKTKVIKNILWLLGEHGIRLASVLITTSILARVLGVENYGIFNYITGIVTIFMSLSFICGAEVIVPQLTTANIKTQKEIMGNAFAIRLFFSIIAYCLLAIFVFFTDTLLSFYLTLILGVQILLSESFGVITAYFQSKTIIKYKTIPYITALILKTIFFVGLYLYGIKNIYIYASFSIFEFTFMAILTSLIYKKLNGDMFFTYSFKQSFLLLKRGFSFFLGIVFMYIYLKLDIVMLKYLSDNTSLGLYASSKTLYNSIVATAPMICMSFAPLFVYKFNDYKIVKRNIIYLSIFMFSIGIIGAIILNILSPFLINLIYGENFSPSIPILTSMVWILPLYFLNEALNIYLIKLGLGKILTYKWMISLIISLIAYTIFIPQFNTIGCILGFGLGYMTSCLYGIYIISNERIKNEL